MVLWCSQLRESGRIRDEDVKKREYELRGSEGSALIELRNAVVFLRPNLRADTANSTLFVI